MMFWVHQSQLSQQPPHSSSTGAQVHEMLTHEAEQYRFVALCFPAPPILFPLLSTLLPLLLSGNSFLNISSDRTLGKSEVKTATFTVKQCSLASALVMCCCNFLTASSDNSFGYKHGGNTIYYQAAMPLVMCSYVSLRLLPLLLLELDS